MTRRRFVQIKGELIEVPLDYQPVPANADAVLWNDRAYQDMNDPRFRSRTEHREYMRRNGLTTVDDFRKHDARNAQLRAAFYQGKDPTRKQDIARALEKHRG